MSKVTLNMSAGKNKSGKQGRPLLMAKLAEKKPGQQTIQFSSSITKPAEALIISDQAFGLVLEAVGGPTNVSMEAAPFPFS